MGVRIMPRKDLMTSRERFVAALTGKPYDRIPVFLLMSDHAARVIGVTVGEYQKSAELMAKGQLEAWRLYGMDLINTGPGLTGIAEAIGSKLAFPRLHGLCRRASGQHARRPRPAENSGPVPRRQAAAVS